MTTDLRPSFSLGRPSWCVPVVLGGFVLGFMSPIYQVLGDLRIFEDGPVLLIFEYPDDDTRVIGALCFLVVAGAACRVGSRSKPRHRLWPTAGILVFLVAVGASALWGVRLLHLPAPEANTAVRLWFAAVAAASVVGAAVTARLPVSKS